MRTFITAVILSFSVLCTGCNFKEGFIAFLENDTYTDIRSEWEKTEDNNRNEWLNHYNNPDYKPKYRNYSGMKTNFPPGVSPMLKDVTHKAL